MRNTKIPVDQVAPIQSGFLPAPDYFPKRRMGMNVRAVEGETLILDRARGLIHQLNPTASYIWEHCDGSLSVNAIVLQLTEVFDVGLETATREVSETIQQFQKLHLLEG